MNERQAKSIGIKEIAAALRISIGTVDRALHARPGVSPKTRAQVLKMAEKLNYRPNIAARSLKLNRRVQIAVYLPQQIASFYAPLRAGISAAGGTAHGLNLDLEFRTYRRLGEGDSELMQIDLDRGYDGVIISPGDPLRIDPIIHRLAQQGTAVVCVASDAPRSDRLAAISIDANASGGLAAELLGRTIKEKGTVAILTGQLGTQDHAEKLRGFAATLATLAPHLSLLPAIESHEHPEEAYASTLALLQRKPHPVGIYVSTANSLPVLRALEERRLLGHIEIITTDLYPELVTYIESGKILATLYQRPFTQGKVAIETLTKYLAEGIKPEPVTRLAPHIILRSNLPLFLNRLVPETDNDADDRSM
jgi:LacI family transcriptional regulator